MDYLDKSLAELDPVGSSGIDIKHKKIQDYSIEDLSVVIGREVGLAYLVPVAMLNLISQPFVNNGELLISMLEVRAEFWAENPMYVSSMKRLCKLVKAQVNEVGVSAEVKGRILELVSAY